MMSSLTQLLEEIAANAWPPLRVQHLAGWRLRFSEGVHSRANSVWPNEDSGHLSLAEKLATVETFYHRYGLPARYQISPASQPASLDSVLEARGYTLYEPVEVQTAVLSATLSQTTSTHSVTIESTLPTDWLDFDVRISQRQPHPAAIRRQIMSYIAPQAAFAAVRQGDDIVGIGLGVYERGWLGIFNMLTDSQRRGEGIGTAVLHALAEWGQQQGATQAYLQVVAANSPAQSLYQHAGFKKAYTYHYRQQRGVP